MKINITDKEKKALTHVLSKSSASVFGSLWVDLKWDSKFFKEIHNGNCSIYDFSKKYASLDANFNDTDMTISITQVALDGLNEMLKFSGYDKLDNNLNPSGLSITIK